MRNLSYPQSSDQTFDKNAQFVTMLLAKGTVLNKKWEIGELVGEGACGRVYAVKGANGIINPFPLVAKVIPTSLGTGKAASDQKRLCDTLNYEYTLFIGNLCEFSYRPNIPDIRTFHGIDAAHGVRFMVMERFERDLVGYAVNSNPDNRSVANIGLQILEGLQWMHAKGLIFVDVKPDNFMLNGEALKFVDFGLVERWLSAVGPGARIFCREPSSTHDNELVIAATLADSKLYLTYIIISEYFTLTFVNITTINLI